MGRLLEKLIVGLAGAAVATGVILGLGVSKTTKPTKTADPPAATQSVGEQLKNVESGVQGLQSTAKRIETKDADIDVRVQDIQKRLKRCPCGKTSRKIARRTTVRKPAPRKLAAARPVPQPRQTQPVIQVNVPPTIVVNSNNTTGIPLYPPLPAAANKPGANVILNYNNTASRISPGTPETPSPAPSVAPTPVPPQPQRHEPRTKKKESRWRHFWQEGWCNCGGTQFAPRWGG